MDATTGRLFILVALAVAFAACNGGSPTTSPAPVTTPNPTASATVAPPAATPSAEPSEEATATPSPFPTPGPTPPATPTPEPTATPNSTPDATEEPTPIDYSYNRYSTTGTPSQAGSYSFLTGSGSGGASGDSGPTVITTYERMRRDTRMLRLNTSDAAGGGASGEQSSTALASVQVGELIEWRKASDCFVRFRVTSVSSSRSGYREFGVYPETYAFQSCQAGVLPTDVSAVDFNAASSLALEHLGGVHLAGHAVVHGVWELYPNEHVARETDVLVPEGVPAHVPDEFANVGKVTTLVDARKFPYWREPSLPPGWHFYDLWVRGGMLPPGYEANFAAADGYHALTIEAVHETVRPLPREATWLANPGRRGVHEPRVIAGRPAVVSYSPEGPQHHATASIFVEIYDAPTETIYTVRGAYPSHTGGETALERVLVIASSLFEGPNPP